MPFHLHYSANLGLRMVTIDLLPLKAAPHVLADSAGATPVNPGGERKRENREFLPKTQRTREAIGRTGFVR